MAPVPPPLGYVTGFSPCENLHNFSAPIEEFIRQLDNKTIRQFMFGAAPLPFHFQGGAICGGCAVAG